ncbi:MAG: hypothetical protein GXO05_03490 [Aquificae bacterium]|nr:hypothetical protein [Aquificota bacterium]
MKICGLDFPEENLKKHFVKRKREGFVKKEEEYLSLIKETLKRADRFYVIRQLQDCVDKLVFFNSLSNWLVIVLMEEKRILTCFKLWKAKTIEGYFRILDFDPYLRDDCVKDSYTEVKRDENSKYGQFIKAVQNRC